MKKTKLLGWFLMGLTTITSCTNDAEDMLAPEIKLTSEIMPSRVTSLDYQSTRIVEGQQIGVTITGAKSEHRNIAWTAGANGALHNENSPVYWGETDITVTSYHPYNADFNGTSYVFSVHTDQSANAGYLNSDLLWATKTAGLTDQPIALAFTHQLAKINVTLTSEDIADLSNASIFICGTNIATGFNPATGKGIRFQEVDFTQYDICVTNPPFSMYGEFINTLLDSKIDFIILAPFLNRVNPCIGLPLMLKKCYLGYGRKIRMNFYNPTAENKFKTKLVAVDWITTFDDAQKEINKLPLTNGFKYENYKDDFVIMQNITMKDGTHPIRVESFRGIPDERFNSNRIFQGNSR